MDYSDLYNASWADVSEAKVLPTGHWTLALNGIYFNGPKEDGKSARISFRYVAVEPQGDVNVKALKALGDGYDFAANEDIYNGGFGFYWGSSRDKRKVLAHLEKHSVKLPAGVPFLVDGDGGNPRVNPELMAALRGAKIVAELKVDEYNGEVRNQAENFVPA